jgi:hypothetical protein
MQEVAAASFTSISKNANPRQHFSPDEKPKGNTSGEWMRQRLLTEFRANASAPITA